MKVRSSASSSHFRTWLARDMEMLTCTGSPQAQGVSVLAMVQVDMSVFAQDSLSGGLVGKDGIVLDGQSWRTLPQHWAIASDGIVTH